MAKIPKYDSNLADFFDYINNLVYGMGCGPSFTQPYEPEPEPEPVYKVKISDAIEVEYEVNDVDEHEDLYLTD